MLRRIVSGIAATAAMLLLFVLSAQAEQRIALVIGNAAYAKAPLKTSLADGGLVAEALTSVGFEIVEGADVNQADLRRLFGEFLAKVQAAGPDAIALVYYSGYGLEFEGENYLIPVDARLDRDSDIPIDAVRLFDLMRPLADAPAAAKIFVLDATRPLPFQIQGGRLAPGLGAVASAPGMLVAFSSTPGVAAMDGPGPYGAYATAIAEMVREPGLDLDSMFARIRLRTNEVTNGMQLPWNVSQDLNPQIMLVPAAVAAPGAPAPQRVVRRAERPMRDIGPEEAYALAIQDDNLDGYAEYVRTYPNSPYAPRVWAIIRERREALAWRRALLLNTPEAFWTYLDRYPSGMYAFDAERRLRRLSAGLRPPAGFRMLDFDDVPPPLPGEPGQLVDVYPAAPAPRFLGPPPAYIVGLPPPGRPGGPGLWRRPNNPFPIITSPGPGEPPRIAVPPGGIPLQKKGPVIVTPTPGGPQPQFQKKGPEFQKKGPVIVNQPPPGGPPPGGPSPQFLKKGPAVVNQPPSGTTPARRSTLPVQQQQQIQKGPAVQQLQQPTTPKQPTVAPPPPPPPPPPPKGPSRGAPPGQKCPIVNGQPQCKGA